MRKKSTFKKTEGGGGHATRISLKLSIYISLKLRTEFIGNWATLIFSLQKPCTRIISHMLHSFLHFSKAIDVISYPKKRIPWEFEKIDFQKLQISAERDWLFLGPKSGFILHSGDTLQHLKGTDHANHWLVSWVFISHNGESFQNMNYLTQIAVLHL